MRVQHRFVVALVVACSMASTVAALPGGSPASAATPACPWLATGLSVEQRVHMALSSMSVDEEATLLHGDPTISNNGAYAGVIPAIPRMCLPDLNLLGGPAGVNRGVTKVTQFPAPVSLAATWDRTLAKSYGAAVGAEDRGKNVQVVLGPTVDIVRDPRWGRAFETYGEDPFLNGRLAVANINGLQSNGVIAQVKHLAAYNQETYRLTTADNVVVDERTLQEMYLPAFQAAVEEGHVGSVMCGYNQVNNGWACENDFLINGVLKKQWAFDGFVTSDWFAVHSTDKSALAGLDMEMPNACFFRNLAADVTAGTLSRARLDDMAARVLRKEFAFGLVGRAPTGGPTASVNTPAHAALARRVAEDGTVLLKNTDNVLPLDNAKLHSVAVVGTDAGGKATTAGGGSAHVTAPYVVTPVTGITERAGPGVAVTYDDGTDVTRAATMAASTDVAVVFASLFERESADLPDITLSAHDNELISAVTAANPHTVVVLNTGSAVTMPWLSSAAGVLEAWYPGQEDGHAIASVLFGDVDPGGRLPVTFPSSIADGPNASEARWPGLGGNVSFDEGLEVGYRWYDAHNVAPLFPFGHGLSYTTFQLSGMTATRLPGRRMDVAVTVKNIGTRAGSDVVQAYVEMPPAVGEPPRRLAGFTKVRLAIGAQTRVHMVIPVQSFSHWDVVKHRWLSPAGAYTIRVGESSRQLPLSTSVTMTTPLYTGRVGPAPTALPPAAGPSCTT